MNNRVNHFDDWCWLVFAVHECGHDIVSNLFLDVRGFNQTTDVKREGYQIVTREFVLPILYFRPI